MFSTLPSLRVRTLAAALLTALATGTTGVALAASPAVSHGQNHYGAMRWCGAGNPACPRAVVS
jgi:hypothetical protein